jgi:hypothetical protein
MARLLPVGEIAQKRQRFIARQADGGMTNLLSRRFDPHSPSLPDALVGRRGECLRPGVPAGELGEHRRGAECSSGGQGRLEREIV